MDNHLTAVADDHPPRVPVVFLPADAMPRPDDTDTPPGAPLADTIAPTRTARIKIMQWQPPVLFVEATPGAARDLQELAGIKQVEPRPDASAPDRCGSAYYTAIVSLLFDARTIFANVEELNLRDALSETFEVCEI